MDQTKELPEDVKRLLLNLESDSQQVVTEAIQSLDAIGNTDPRVITTLRKLAGEKKNWYIQMTRAAFNLANKLSQQAATENLQQLHDLIEQGESPDRDLLLRILQLQMELERRQAALQKSLEIRNITLAGFMILTLLLSSR
jgi:hypothetical protein